MESENCISILSSFGATSRSKIFRTTTGTHIVTKDGQKLFGTCIKGNPFLLSCKLHGDTFGDGTLTAIILFRKLLHEVSTSVQLRFVIDILLRVCSTHYDFIYKEMIRMNAWKEVNDIKYFCSHIWESILIPATNPALASNILNILQDIILHGRCQNIITNNINSTDNIYFINVIQIIPKISKYSNVQSSILNISSLSSLINLKDTGVSSICDLIPLLNKHKIKAVITSSEIIGEALYIFTQANITVIDRVPMENMEILSKRVNCRVWSTIPDCIRDINDTPPLDTSSLSPFSVDLRDTTCCGCCVSMDQFSLGGRGSDPCVRLRGLRRSGSGSSGQRDVNINTNDIPIPSNDLEDEGGREDKIDEDEDIDGECCSAFQLVLSCDSNTGGTILCGLLCRCLRAVVAIWSHRNDGLRHKDDGLSMVCVPGGGAAEMAWSFLWTLVGRILAGSIHSVALQTKDIDPEHMSVNDRRLQVSMLSSLVELCEGISSAYAEPPRILMMNANSSGSGSGSHSMNVSMSMGGSSNSNGSSSSSSFRREWMQWQQQQQQSGGAVCSQERFQTTPLPPSSNEQQQQQQQHQIHEIISPGEGNNCNHNDNDNDNHNGNHNGNYRIGLILCTQKISDFTYTRSRFCDSFEKGIFSSAVSFLSGFRLLLENFRSYVRIGGSDSIIKSMSMRNEKQRSKVLSRALSQSSDSDDSDDDSDSSS
eukprot:gene6130-12413_t